MKKININRIIALAATILMLGSVAALAESDTADTAEETAVAEVDYKGTQQVVVPSDVSVENAKELRIAAMEAINAEEAETLEDEIRQRLYTWWGEWKPDYEGWLECANDLYAENATIYAIGGEQKFSDYKVSMKDQRDACEMEMGPIMQMIVDGNTAALVYNMYLTPKGMDDAPTFVVMITEFNTFEEIDGRLMVTRLDLYTDGGAMGSMMG